MTSEPSESGADPRPAESGHTLLAPIPPLDVTGVRTVTIGTIAWALAFVALLPFYGRLDDNHDLWWYWTCAVGFGLGLLGRTYCRRREQHLRADARDSSAV